LTTLNMPCSKNTERNSKSEITPPQFVGLR
jgi:hypothetical protein